MFTNAVSGNTFHIVSHICYQFRQLADESFSHPTASEYSNRWLQYSRNGQYEKPLDKDSASV